MHLHGGLGAKGRDLMNDIVHKSTLELTGWPKTQRVLQIRQTLDLALMREVGRQLSVCERMQAGSA